MRPGKTPNLGGIAKESLKSSIYQSSKNGKTRSLQSRSGVAIWHSSFTTERSFHSTFTTLRSKGRLGSFAILAVKEDLGLDARPNEPLPANTHVKARIQLHTSPTESPDLDPMEGIWLLLNEKLKLQCQDRLAYIDYWELRTAVKAVWETITLEEIRERIADMPWRCGEVVRTGGDRVKGK